MKKSFTYRLIATIFLLNFFLCVSYADPVDSLLAKTVAQNFYNNKAGKTATKLTLVYTEKSDNNIPVYYIYNINDKDGFVIVSGENSTEPILGYSFEGEFRTQNISPEFAYWMNCYKTQILFIQKKSVPFHKEIHDKWNVYRTANFGNLTTFNNTTVVGPLLSTQWDQSNPFNHDCPSSNAFSNCLTGCVATAMAQIMKYWNYPVHGIGYHEYSHPLGLQFANFSASNYDWSSMPNQLQLLFPNAEISRIIYHCGVSVDMNYCQSGSQSSGAWTIATDGEHSAQEAYVQYFNYNSSLIRSRKKNDYSLLDWIDTLKNELDKSRPIQYVGAGADGSHSWVCDGYSGNYFHMNWGWGGYYNSWFLLTDLTPANAEFNENQKALLGIYPYCQIAELTPIGQSVDNNNPHSGNAISVSCAENNDGETAAGPNKIKIYLSNNPVLNFSTATYLGQIPVPNVPALGQTTLLNTSVNIPTNISTGQYWLFVMADGDRTIQECNEDNNYSTVLLNIIGSACVQPQNDDCSGNFNATPLIFSTTTCNFVPKTSCGATSSGFNACSGNADDDVFFKFTPTTSNVTIKVASTTGYDAVFQLLAGPCGTSMQSVSPGCINNTADGGLESHSYTGLVAGNTYFIRVWHAGADWGSGNFSICVFGSSCSTPGTSTSLTPGTSTLPGQIINTSTPQMNWSLASGATRYVVRISKEPYGFNNNVYTSACVTPPLTIPTGILQNGSNYRWDVEALFACGSSCSSLSSDRYFTVSTEPCTTPVTQSSNIIFPGISSNQLNVAWTNGDGDRRIVVINTTNSFTAPVNGTSITANSTYSGSGEQVVYDGNSGSVVVAGLSPSTNYCFRVYEANCSGTLSYYNTSTATNNPVCQTTSSGACTIPITQASNISFFNIGTNSIALNWSSGNGSKRVVKINTVNTFTAPANGTDPTANSIYAGSGEQVVYNGSGNSITISGLTLNTNYCFKVYEANCTGSQILYNTSNATNNSNCQSTTPSCGTLQIPVPLVGDQTCPGPGFYNSSVLLNWSVTNSGRYDIEVREYPYGSNNIVYSQYCISENTKFINSNSLSPGNLYSWRVRSTADCNNCIGNWSQPYYFHMAPDITPNGTLNICNNIGISLSTSIISPPSTATVTYQWYKVNPSGSDIPVGTNTNTFFASTSGNYYVKLIYNGTGICPGSDTTYASQIDVINIGYTPPTPTLGTNSPVFQGSDLLLSASNLGSGNIDYFWSGPNGFASNSQNPTISSVNQSGAGNYFCYLINNGCISDIDTIQVFVVLPNHKTYKYWFDNRYDNSLAADMGAGNNLTLQQNISTSQLDFGLHVFNIEFMDSDGKWSSIISSFFYKPLEILSPPAQYEYWFDNNYPNKTLLTNSSTNNLIVLNDISTGTLTDGLHTFNIRFRPDGKTWSSTTSSFFYKADVAASGTPQYEYWFDTAHNNKITTSIPSTSNFILLDNIVTTSINNGLHTLHFRFMPDGKKWSSVTSSFFYKDNDVLVAINDLAKYVYWFDNNWQSPKTISIIGTQNIAWTLNTDVADLSEGPHSLSMAFKDDRGKWSSIVTDNFNRGPITAQSCLSANRQFISGIIAASNSTYQWQLDNGTGFANITNDATYSGVNSDTLQLTNAATSWYGNKYRCLVTNGTNTSTGETNILKFAMIWNGSADTAWENPANWSCNSVPDLNTDVYINASMPRYPAVNTNVACRSLNLQPGTTIEIKPGITLDVTGKNQ